MDYGKKRIAFDLDNTLCVGDPYIDAKPLTGMIEIVNQLYNEGHTIIIYTARGMSSCENAKTAINKYWHLTYSQLMKWGIKFHYLAMGKPNFDILIDDKAINSLCIIDTEDVKKYLNIV
jgi:hypothetical protein